MTGKVDGLDHFLEKNEAQIAINWAGPKPT